MMEFLSIEQTENSILFYNLKVLIYEFEFGLFRLNYFELTFKWNSFTNLNPNLA